MTKNVTDASFADDVLAAPGLVLVDFWAPWCGPCRQLGPILDALADDYAGKIAICKLNVDDNPQTSRQFGVRNIPFVMLFKNGEPVESSVGLRPKNEFASLIDKHLADVAA